MNQELSAITDKIAEFSGEIILKNSQENLEKVRSLIANYVDILTTKVGVEEAREILAEPRNNILHIAAKFGAAESLRKVLNFITVDLNKVEFLRAIDGYDAKFYTAIRDDKFFTPLHYAAQKGWEEVVKILLENGADISPKSAPKDREWMPIHYAAKGGHLEVIKTLIANSADKEAKTAFGLTPLLVAAEFGHLPVVEFLLAEKAQKNVKTTEENHCMNALHYAAVGGFDDVTLALIKVGIDKEFKTTSGTTALQFGVSVGDVKVVEVLLENGADRNIQTVSGHDILYLAASKGKKEVLSLLLQWGIGDIEEAIKIAKDHSNKEIVAVLEVYQKAIKNLFAAKNLPVDLVAVIKSFAKENLASDRIKLENDVSFNAYGILNIRQKAGIFSKEKINLITAAENSGNDALVSALEVLEKLTLLQKS
jgi:ankyrin repeat protein